MNEGSLVTVTRCIRFCPISAQPLSLAPPRLLLFLALPLLLGPIQSSCPLLSRMFFPPEHPCQRSTADPCAPSHTWCWGSIMASALPPSQRWHGALWQHQLLVLKRRVGSGAGRGFPSSLFLPRACGGHWGREQPPAGVPEPIMVQMPQICSSASYGCPAAANTTYSQTVGTRQGGHS